MELIYLENLTSKWQDYLEIVKGTKHIASFTFVKNWNVSEEGKCFRSDKYKLLRYKSQAAPEIKEEEK